MTTTSLRATRLLRGTLADLARAEDSRAQGWTTWVDGQPIDAAIASMRSAADAYRQLGGLS